MEIEVGKKLEPKTIWNFVIFLTIGIILTFSILIISEILTAKKECEKIGGDYSLKSFEHKCNNQTFNKYTDGNWRYEQKTINLSEIVG